MNPVELQFEILKGYYPEATLNRLSDNSHLISVKNIQLPAGWSQDFTEVKFIAPVGYPFACPDCFWTDPDLKLNSGSIPLNTANNLIPNVAGNYLWFSWHLSSWNPNTDNLLTYLNVIKRRLQELRCVNTGQTDPSSPFQIDPPTNTLQ